MPDFISFDHDLGDEHYEEFWWSRNDRNPQQGKFRYGAMKEKTGYCAAKWLVKYCLDNNLKMCEYQAHTMNPIGKENIEKLLEAFKRNETTDDN